MAPARIHLRYVEIDQPTPGARTLVVELASIDQVIARSAGISNTATLIAHDSTVTNSIFIATGASGVAVNSDVYYAGTPNTTVTLRNVTAIATGSGGVGILGSGYGTPTNLLLRTINVIAQRRTGRVWPGGRRRGLRGDHHGRRLALQLPEREGLRPERERHSCRQRRQPDRDAGLPRRRSGRLSRGRRIADDRRGRRFRANGTGDVDGDARTVGQTDIGADEFVAPPVGGPTPPAGGGTPPSVFVGVKLASTRLRFDGRHLRAVVSCPAGTPGGCTGSAKLTARRRVTGSRALSTLRLGRARLAIRAGQRKTVRMRVPLSARRWLRSAHRRRGQATLVARNGVGQSRTNVTRVRIIRR